MRSGPDGGARRAAARAEVTVRPGQLVTSRAGRDKGQAFIVLGVEGDRVLVADGRLRRVARPKRKNVRHLQPHQAVHAGLAGALAAGRPIGDRDVRRAIEELTGEPAAGRTGAGPAAPSGEAASPAEG
jgi:hypothetical protein